VSKEFDTSWFDLKKYENLIDLDLIGWHRQIQIRSFLLWAMSDPDYKDLIPLHKATAIKENPILKPYIPDEEDAERFNYLIVKPKGRSVVNDTTALEHWQSANDDRFSHIWDICKLDNEGLVTEEQAELISIPMSALYKSFEIDTGDIEGVTIDLTATDEQITKDFSEWLSNYRKNSTRKASKRNFTDKDFKNWIQWRLLPYVDLIIISKIEGVSITQAKAANLIYSDASMDTDIVDRLRKTTKPKASILFTEETEQALEAQIKCMALET
jgi:hypothetical protein